MGLKLTRLKLTWTRNGVKIDPAKIDLDKKWGQNLARRDLIRTKIDPDKKWG